jgi:hypothetical protein
MQETCKASPLGHVAFGPDYDATQHHFIQYHSKQLQKRPMRETYIREAKLKSNLEYSI